MGSMIHFGDGTHRLSAERDITGALSLVVTQAERAETPGTQIPTPIEEMIRQPELARWTFDRVGSIDAVISCLMAIRGELDSTSEQIQIRAARVNAGVYVALAAGPDDDGEVRHV